MYSTDGHQIYVNVDSAQRLPSVPDWCIPGPAIRCGGGIPHKMEGRLADGARFSHLPYCFRDILFSNECSSWTKTTNSLNSRGYALQYCSFYHAHIARLWPIGDCDIKERSGVSSSLNFTKLSPSGQPGSPTRSLKFVLRKVMLAGLFNSFLRRDETDVF